MMQPNTGKEEMLQKKVFFVGFFWFGKVIKMVTYKTTAINYACLLKQSISQKWESNSKLTRKVRHLLICWLYKVMRDTNAYKAHDFSFILIARNGYDRTLHHA